jgi:hypothetical protein
MLRIVTPTKDKSQRIDDLFHSPPRQLTYLDIDSLSAAPYVLSCRSDTDNQLIGVLFHEKMYRESITCLSQHRRNST